jgi:hypothetical protein
VESDADTAVRVLLDAAQIRVSDEELALFAETLPALRAHAEGLYLPHLAGEDLALSFDPSLEEAGR